MCNNAGKTTPASTVVWESLYDVIKGSTYEGKNFKAFCYYFMLEHCREILCTGILIFFSKFIKAGSFSLSYGMLFSCILQVRILTERKQRYWVIFVGEDQKKI